MKPPKSRSFILVLVLAAVLTSARGTTGFKKVSLRQDLIAALGSARPFEGRLSEFPYDSPSPIVLTQKSSRSLEKLLARLRKVPVSNLSSYEMSDMAVAIAMLGDLDAAIEYLHDALSQRQSPPELVNDLAVLYIERAKVKSQPQDIITAISLVDTVFRDSSASGELLFNKALGLERMGLLFSTRLAWQHASSREQVEEWQIEINERQATLMRDFPSKQHTNAKMLLAAARKGQIPLGLLVQSSIQEARSCLEAEILPGWVKARWSNLAKEESSYLRVAQSIGAMLAARGDRLIQDSITRALLLLSERPTSERAYDVESGFILYGDGLKQYESGNYVAAADLFRTSEVHLRKSGIPLSYWAALHQSRCEFQRANYSMVRSSLGNILRDPRSSGYPSLLGKVYWVLGLTSLVQGKFEDSVDELNRSLAHYASTKEEASIVAVQGIISEAYESSGDPDASWSHLHSALLASRGIREAHVRHIALEEGALAALSMQEPSSALYFIIDMLHIAQMPRDEVLLASAWRNKAYVELQQEKFSSSQASLINAESAVRYVRDPGVRDIMQGDILLVRGAAKIESSPLGAVQDLDSALRILAKTDYQLALPELHFRRAKAYKKLGLTNRAELELSAAIDNKESQRATFGSDGIRSAFFDTARSIFDEMILLQLEKKRIDKALEYAERGRARALLDWLSMPNGMSDDGRLSHSADSRSIREALRSIPSDTVVVAYRFVGGRLLVWAYGGGGLTMHSSPLDEAALRNQLNHLSRSIRNRDRDSFDEDARRLYMFLVDPVRRRLAPFKRVVFVPDGLLHAVPYVSLIDRESGRYLVQDYIVSVAPSISTFVECMRKGEQYSDAPLRRALVVSDPQFDRHRFPGLPRLKGLDGEISAIGDAFPKLTALLGSSATKASFLRLVQSKDLIHFSGHSILNLSSPALSKLVLAPDVSAGDIGVLYAYEILRNRQSLADARLVVLAACSTARGQVYRGEGVLSLARSFLAAGVPSVVASLWDVDRNSASRFVADFYDNLPGSMSSAIALRSAQLGALSSKDDDLAAAYVWAAFENLGAF